MVFQSENRYRLCPFWSGNNSYEETIGVINIFVVSFPSELCKFEMDFKRSFCWPSNDCIISTFVHMHVAFSDLLQV